VLDESDPEVERSEEVVERVAVLAGMLVEDDCVLYMLLLTAEALLVLRVVGVEVRSVVQRSSGSLEKNSDESRTLLLAAGSCGGTERGGLGGNGGNGGTPILLCHDPPLSV